MFDLLNIRINYRTDSVNSTQKYYLCIYRESDFELTKELADIVSELVN